MIRFSPKLDTNTARHKKISAALEDLIVKKRETVYIDTADKTQQLCFKLKRDYNIGNLDITYVAGINDINNYIKFYCSNDPEDFPVIVTVVQNTIMSMVNAIEREHRLPSRKFIPQLNQSSCCIIS